jgi:hypothetical protein
MPPPTVLYEDFRKILDFPGAVFPGFVPHSGSGEIACQLHEGHPAVQSTAHCQLHIQTHPSGYQWAGGCAEVPWSSGGPVRRQELLGEVLPDCSGGLQWGGDRDRRRFSHHIDTDGVSVSLHLEKAGKDKKGEEELEPEILTSKTDESRYVKETRDLDQGVRDAKILDDTEDLHRP